MLRFEDSVSVLSGVGPKRLLALAEIGVETIGDLLTHLPLRYEDRRGAAPIASLADARPAVVRGSIESLEIRKAHHKNLYIATLEIADDTAAARVVFFGGIKSFSAFRGARAIAVYGAPAVQEAPVPEFVGPEYLLLKDADDAIPLEWGRVYPVYPTTAGLSRGWLAALIYRTVCSRALTADDPLPAEILRKYDFSGISEALRALHAPLAPEEIEPARRRMAYQELFVLQQKVAAAARRRKRQSAPSLAEGRAAAGKLFDSLPFEPTPSQRAAAAQIAADLSQAFPMHRLLQGDVGSGKTVVALAAAAMAATAGYQTAVLVPTTILSAQFYRACAKHLVPLGVRCAELRGAMPKRAKRALLDALAAGEIDVLVGTHALLEDDVVFGALALAVIDEQHRFGVAQRERIARKSASCHVLMMTATPIPRTMCMAFYGHIDVQVLAEKPACRKPVATKIVSENHIGDVYSFLAGRLRDGERCYWVCPAIGEGGDADGDSSVMARAADIERHLSGLRAERLHGKMSADEKAAAMERFAAGATNLLIATTVIEVGVDVPEANLMVIESASAFGLAQLHQLRGRIGRGDRAGICILLDSARNLKDNKRLAILLESDDGFRIAEEDLKLRGAGDVTGLRQHGEADFRIASLPEDTALLEAAVRDVALAEKA